MKRLALNVLRRCGGFAITRSLTARKARILMYHDFCTTKANQSRATDPTALREQFAYLRRHFHVMHLSQLVETLRDEKEFDGAAVAVTVDDGRRNFYEVMFPLLQEFEIPATFFVVTSFINGDDWIWTDKIIWLSKQPSAPCVLSESVLDQVFSRLNVRRPEERNSFIAAMATKMGMKIPSHAPAEYAPCSWAELRAMADSGLVEIGSHTVSHPILATLSDEESRQEISSSLSQVELEVGRAARMFCFPNGKEADYRASQVSQVREAGYRGAVSARSGMVTNVSDPFELPRLGISGYTDFLSFSKIVSGVEHYQSILQQAVRRRSD